MQRLLVIGAPGSGKSTFARKLGLLTGLPVIHLDREFWKPGWRAPAPREWQALSNRLADQPRWIMDGNFPNTLPYRLSRADGVIVLDMPRWLAFARTLRRSVFALGRQRKDMGSGCPERVDTLFLRYTWRFKRDTEPRIASMIAQSEKPVMCFRSRKEMERWLATVERSAAQPAK